MYKRQQQLLQQHGTEDLTIVRSMQTDYHEASGMLRHCYED